MFSSQHKYARALHNTSHWDDVVESWEEVADSAAFQRFARYVHSLAEPRPDDRVVDLGAGTGLLTLAFAPAVSSVAAVDSSSAMLERLEERAQAAGARNVESVCADLCSLPLADESVTLAVSNYAFHHLDDLGKELALAEARRVLEPGGRLVVCDMMFSLSLARRDRAVIGAKLWLILRRGPAGLVRIGHNAYRLARGRWEQPAPLECWAEMLERRCFSDVSVRALEHEAGIAQAHRPTLPRRGHAGARRSASESPVTIAARSAGRPLPQAG